MLGSWPDVVEVENWLEMVLRSSSRRLIWPLEETMPGSR
jgi:hypothetical protein